MSPIRKPPHWHRQPPHWAFRRLIRAPGRRRFSSPCTATLHEQPLQPSEPRFVPALHPPEEAPRAALWFPFSGDRLLVRPDGQRVVLLDYADLAQFGIAFEEGHYLGRLDDVD